MVMMMITVMMIVRRGPIHFIIYKREGMRKQTRESMMIKSKSVT